MTRLYHDRITLNTPERNKTSPLSCPINAHAHSTVNFLIPIYSCHWNIDKWVAPWILKGRIRDWKCRILTPINRYNLCCIFTYCFTEVYEEVLQNMASSSSSCGSSISGESSNGRTTVFFTDTISYKAASQ